MALFEVEGWDLKLKNVQIGGRVNKKKQKNEKRKAKKQEEAALKEKADADAEAEEKGKKRKHVEMENSEDLESKNKEEDNDNSSTVDSAPQEPLPISTQKLTPLQQKMMAKLSGSRFRWINEQLYTISSQDALKLIKEQPSLFDEYHQGFRSQVQSWPENPVDVFVNQIKTRASARPVNAPGGLPGLPNKKVVIADMGCGEAQLALDVNTFTKEYNATNSRKKSKPSGGKRAPSGPKRLDITVHSFDLKKANNRITVADIKNVPLPDESCTIVIFCLALMGTNFLDFVSEAKRILAPGGELWIAEIKSRFSESAEAKVVKKEEIGTEFVESLKLCGFFHKKTDNENKMFSRFEFFKPAKNILEERKAKLERRKKFVEHESQQEQFESKRSEVPEGKWLLKPCIYKRR